MDNILVGIHVQLVWFPIKICSRVARPQPAFGCQVPFVQSQKGKGDTFSFG